MNCYALYYPAAIIMTMFMALAFWLGFILGKHERKVP